MSSWREQIVRRFVPKVARVTAVSDPDGLLRDPGVFQAIQAGGFSIVQFEDSVSFRYDYERRFRSKWDAAYPFVGSVGEALGRLLKLQSEAHRADMQRRLREQHGNRDFVNRITRYDVSSFLDWGVIAETKKAGVYLPGKQVQPRNAEQVAWLAEAVLISRGESQMPFSQLCHHPLLFPIKLETFNAAVLRANPHLRVERQSGAVKLTGTAAVAKR